MSDLTDLVAALGRFDSLPPVERARLAPSLIDQAKSALSVARAAAMSEATSDGGMSQAQLARELGISRSKVNEALQRLLRKANHAALAVALACIDAARLASAIA
jgi:DNA-binding CsgD family transcriptional regulator